MGSPRITVLFGFFLSLLTPLSLPHAAEADDAAHPAGRDRVIVTDAAAVTDPVYIGWDRACVVHRYSPAEGKWSSWKGPRAFVPRAAIPVVGPHAAAVLDSAGSYDGWLFDLHAKTWSAIPASPFKRKGGIMDPVTAAFVAGDLVVWGLIAGDVQGAVLDTRAMKWRPMAAAPMVPRYRAAAAVAGSKLMIWGGYGPLGPRRIGPLEDGAVYDASTDTWLKMPPPPTPGHRYGCSAMTSKGRFILFGVAKGGGPAAEGMVFDPATGKWDTIAAPPVEVGVQSACAADDERLFVWSGRGAAGGPEASAAGAVYDFRTRKWTRLPEAPIVPRVLASARIHGRAVTVWGGWEEGPTVFLMDGATYELGAGAWTEIAPPPGDVPPEMHPGW